MRTILIISILFLEIGLNAQHLDVEGDVKITGNMGIGTDPSVNVTLEVSNTENTNIAGDGHKLRLSSNTTGLFGFRMDVGNNHLVLDRFWTDWRPTLSINRNSGHIGIGTSTPTALLEVDGNVKINGLISNISDPVGDQDAATKAYVDARVAGSIGNYGTVVNPVTGKVWLDHNLGATQVATSSNDAASFGDLYQWGRGADGHQVRTSGTTATQATNWLSGSGSWSGLFITTHSNWLSTGDTDLWSGTAAENNPCPSGFRVPTNAEWEQERLTWSSNNAAGAFASPLKLPLAGFRVKSNGSLGNVGSFGYYWSSTVDGTDSRYLFFFSSSAYMNPINRASGSSVRCLKD